MNSPIWIGGGHILRKQFVLKAAPVHATVEICGLGWFVLEANGRRVGQDQLVPAQTNYEKYYFYLQYDILEWLSSGSNELNVRLGEGFYAQSWVRDRWGWEKPYGNRKLWLELTCRYADGTVEKVQSDLGWEASSDGFVWDNPYTGEFFDARALRRWQPVIAESAPGGVPVRQLLPPERILAEKSAVAITYPAEGTAVFDFGAMISGWGKLCLEAGEDRLLRLRYAEELNSAGFPDFDSTGDFATGVIPTDQYCPRGEAGETWMPSFTYHGFRYIELTGYRHRPTVATLTAQLVHNDLARIGEFHCSSELVNRIYQTSVDTLATNLHSLPTDCPNREKCGWLGDAQVIADFADYVFDMREFWRKYLNDLSSSEQDGVLPMIAPGRRRCGAATPAWGAAAIFIPWRSYLHYADREILADHYEMMKRFLARLGEQAPDGILRTGLGDWCEPGRVQPVRTPVAFTSTAIFCECARLMSRIAGVLGQTDDQRAFTAQQEYLAQRLREEFYCRAEHSFGSQSANAIALHLQLGNAAVAATLNAQIIAENYHFTTGILGLKHLFRMLCEHGYADTALALLEAPGYPGFRDLLDQGAVSWWETWEKQPADEPTPRSRNHPMQAGFAMFFPECLGGIRPDEEAPGFARILLRPAFPRQLRAVKTALRLPDGRTVRSDWHREDDALIWELALPVPGTIRLAEYGRNNLPLPPGRHRILLKKTDL